MLDPGVDFGSVAAHFVVDQAGFGGLEADDAPFVGDEAVEELGFGVGLGSEQGEPAATEEVELGGVFVFQEEGSAGGLRTGVATVLELGALRASATGVGDGAFGLGAVDAGLFGTRPFWGSGLIVWQGSTHGSHYAGGGRGNPGDGGCGGGWFWGVMWFGMRGMGESADFLQLVVNVVWVGRGRGGFSCGGGPGLEAPGRRGGGGFGGGGEFRLFREARARYSRFGMREGRAVTAFLPWGVNAVL